MALAKEQNLNGGLKFQAYATRTLLAGAAYFAAAKAGLAFAIVHQSITAIWPPSGIALAVLYLFGLRTWPGILLASLLANFSQGTPLAVSLGIASGNTFAAAVGAALLRHLPDFRPDFSRIRDVLLFLLIGVALDPVVSASLGVLSLHLGGILDIPGIPQAWIGWWSGDAIGVLILAPTLIVLFSRQWQKPTSKKTIEAALLLAATFAFAILVFRANEPYMFLIYPLSVWAAIRFQHLGVITVALSIAGVSIPLLIYNSGMAGSVSKSELLYEIYRLQLFLSSSAITGMLLSADIISRTRAEFHLAEKESSARAKDQFIATLSHELRTPLTSILAWAQLIKSGRLDEQTQKSGIQAIEDCALMQNQLVNDLLDVSRIVTGKLVLNRKRIHARDALRNALNTILPSARKKNIEIRERCEISDLEVLADPIRLKQVFWNLLANAVKFTPEGGWVEVAMDSPDARTMRFRVSDNGEGIAPEVLPTLFRRFSQADSSHTRTHGGLGLGLSLVRSLLDLQDGSVSVESGGKGKGSTFTVLLPLLERLEQEAAPVPANSSRSVQAGDLSGWKTLIVDDDPNTLEALRVTLFSAGAQVRVAASAAEADDILANYEPDVLLCDIAMPREDGFHFMRRLRASGEARLSRLPALAFSASAGSEVAREAEQAGFQSHLTKPVENAVLVRAILSVGAEKRVT